MQKRILKVFLASPSDVARERGIFKEVVDELNAGFGTEAGVQFKRLMWEDLPGVYADRPQALINGLVDECDLFIMLLHERWGNPEPNSEYSAYTEEELHKALDRHKRTKTPFIALIFKEMRESTRNNPDAQAQRVIRFKEEAREKWLRPLECADEHIVRVAFDRYLRQLANGELPEPAEDTPPFIPVKTLEELERCRREAEDNRRANEISDLAYVKELIDNAQQRGNLPVVFKKIENLLKRSRFVSVFHVLSLFFFELGDLDNAERLATYILEGTNGIEVAEDIASHLLGMVWKQRGNLVKAEAFCRRSLELSEKSDHAESTLDDYGNLAEILKEKGDLVGAELAIQKILKLASVGSEYFSGAKRTLATVRIYERKPEEAWQLLQESLAAATAQGNPKEICMTLMTIGLFHDLLYEPEKSLAAYAEALKLARELQDVEKIGTAANGLGLAYRDLKDAEHAKEYLEEALSAFSSRRDTQRMMAVNTNIGGLKLEQKELAGAEAFLRTALSQALKVNNARAQIEIKRNLSKVFTHRREFDEAIAVLEECLAESQRIGNELLCAMALSDMGHVWKKKGIIYKARECFRRALQLCRSENNEEGIASLTKFLREL